MSKDDNDDKDTGVYNQSVPGTDCLNGIDPLDDLLGSTSGVTLSLPPLTGGGTNPFTMNGTSANSSYSYPYVSPAYSPNTYTTGSSGSFSWGSPITTPVNINNYGIELTESCDIKIGAHSLKDFMKAVSDRLAILQPDPAKLEKFEALKLAYEHYKTLEALCHDEDPKEDK